MPITTQAPVKAKFAALDVKPSNGGLLKEQAYDELKRRILGETYPPGSFLAERKLAEDLGMSKTPVKAALERLEMEGFIAVSPQQGIVVRERSIHEIADQYEIRAALESYTMRTLAGKLSPAQSDRLHANVAALGKLRGTASVTEAVALDAEFHILFAEFLGNQEILRTMEQLREKMQRVITKVFLLNPGRIEGSHEEHSALVEAVIAGQGMKAARLIEAHLEKGKQLILSPRRG
jgi:DNA-binding GntR family transcriptional regulator